MSSINSLSADRLARLIGTPKCPALIEIRDENEFAPGSRLIPGSVRRAAADAPQWVAEFAGRSAIVIGLEREALSQGVAAWLRCGRVPADLLEGGIGAWIQAGLPLVPAAKLPPRDKPGRTVWVTRARPKIDRIAGLRLIRRFIDPAAVFLFVAPAEVEAVAASFDAAPFDIEGVFWSRRGETCTFDAMIDEFGLETEPLKRLATIVRAADTGRPELAPEAPDLLAASLGLSRIHADDLEQLKAGLVLYDAFYRWCRDVTGETHTWPTNKPEA